MAEIQAKLQSLSEDFNKLQQGLALFFPNPQFLLHLLTSATELQTTIASRQKLEAQKTENLGVQGEFKSLEDGEEIYKLVGPILLKQDKVEAESTVNGRLEFIGKEMLVLFLLSLLLDAHGYPMTNNVFQRAAREPNQGDPRED